SARGAALPGAGHPGSDRGPRRAGRACRVRRLLGVATGRIAPQRRGVAAIEADRLPRRARSRRRRAARRASAPRVLGLLPAPPPPLRVLEAPREPTARAASLHPRARGLDGDAPPAVTGRSGRVACEHVSWSDQLGQRDKSATSHPPKPRETA